MAWQGAYIPHISRGLSLRHDSGVRRHELSRAITRHGNDPAPSQRIRDGGLTGWGQLIPSHPAGRVETPAPAPRALETAVVRCFLVTQ